MPRYCLDWSTSCYAIQYCWQTLPGYHEGVYVRCRLISIHENVANWWGLGWIGTDKWEFTIIQAGPVSKQIFPEHLICFSNIKSIKFRTLESENQVRRFTVIKSAVRIRSVGVRTRELLGFDVDGARFAVGFAAKEGSFLDGKGGRVQRQVLLRIWQKFDGLWMLTVGVILVKPSIRKYLR